jgi:hypothetical protein
MCHQVTCETCARPTWSGCGNHVEQALDGIAKAERCACNQAFAAASRLEPTEDSFTRVLGRLP